MAENEQLLRSTVILDNVCRVVTLDIRRDLKLLGHVEEQHVHGIVNTVASKPCFPDVGAPSFEIIVDGYSTVTIMARGSNGSVME